jgi:site-specific recombinase XerD
MFERLFTRPSALARQRAGPLAKERLAYLTHLDEQGLSPKSLRGVAHYLLVITHYLHLADRPGETIAHEEIERQATLWAKRWSTRPNHSPGRISRATFRSHAARWLRFLGRLEQRPTPVSPYAEFIAAFADYMYRDRGLSPQTIRNRCWFVRRFLDQLGAPGSLREITITRIDEALQAMVSQGGYARVAVQTWASHLRAFFRYAQMRDWCCSGLAQAIESPRVFSQASLPTGPSWEDVQRLLATTEGDRPADIRDRAILLLLAVYGLRAGEVRHLRLEDFDWEQELLSVTCPKTRQTRTYPLSRLVGDAVLRYLKEVRPRSVHRELFLALHAPIRPLRELWGIVAKRLRPLGVSIPHHGPHALRHACAAHLLAQGLSLKEIGDHLGHRDPDATRLYAKVDLVGLRQVGDFDLGGLQ